MEESEEREILSPLPQPVAAVVNDDEQNLVMASDPPLFVREMRDQSVKVGSRTRFFTEILTGSPLCVNWLLNGVAVEEGSRYKFYQEIDFFCLEIFPVFVEDEGIWTCQATNAVQSVERQAQLKVVVPKSYKQPEFLEELQALLTEQGTVSLECKVIGIPTPVLNWYKDGKEIKAGDVFAFTARPDDSTSLGVYTCEAINCVGRAVSISKVHVTGKNSRESSTQPGASGNPGAIAKKKVEPPVVVEEMFNQKVKVGDGVEFTVRVMVPPVPTEVRWYNKDQLKGSSDRYLMKENEEPGMYALNICPTDINDDGEWKCVIQNDGGRAESTSILTLVVPKNYRPPRFLEDLRAILTEEGLVSFECKVVGFPTPQLQWFKDGQELKPGDVYQLSGTNSLGSYSCVARNCMGQSSSVAELTVDDIENQLNEEERRQLMEIHQPPTFIQGLRSLEWCIGDPLRFSVQIASIKSDSLIITWYHDDEPVDYCDKYRMEKDEGGLYHLNINPVEFIDEGDWKCIVINDFGHSVTSCSLQLTIPRYYRKPHFLEPLRAILSEEGTVNLECKVIGVPQPVLQWFKDGSELKPGDIHRIMSGQDGTCCLGTYTCQARNCMGSSSSSASLLSFEEARLAKEEPIVTHSFMEHAAKIARNPSLSTIQEERSSQISLYETASAADSLTGEERAEISVSLDGRAVSLSLYDTPDLTEDDAQKIVELFAEELSERVSIRNTTELPPLRFTRATATSGNLLMEAVVIDVPLEISQQPETLTDISYEEAPTEVDIEELSAMEALIVDEVNLHDTYLDDVVIPDLPYEVMDVRHSLTGLNDICTIQQPIIEGIYRGSFDGEATPRQSSIEIVDSEDESEESVLFLGHPDEMALDSPSVEHAGSDFFSAQEYSDTCSAPDIDSIASPMPDSASIADIEDIELETSVEQLQTAIFQAYDNSELNIHDSVVLPCTTQSIVSGHQEAVALSSVKDVTVGEMQAASTSDHSAHLPACQGTELEAESVTAADTSSIQPLQEEKGTGNNRRPSSLSLVEEASMVSVLSPSEETFQSALEPGTKSTLSISDANFESAKEFKSPEAEMKTSSISEDSSELVLSNEIQIEEASVRYPEGLEMETLETEDLTSLSEAVSVCTITEDLGKATSNIIDAMIKAETEKLEAYEFKNLEIEVSATLNQETAAESVSAEEICKVEPGDKTEGSEIDQSLKVFQSESPQKEDEEECIQTKENVTKTVEEWKLNSNEHLKQKDVDQTQPKETQREVEELGTEKQKDVILEEEQKLKEELERKEEEEIKLKEEQKRKEEEEMKQMEQQKQKKEKEEQQRKKEELRLKEEQQRKEEEELKLKEEQKRMEEKEQQQKEEEELKLKEQQKRKEEEELKLKEEQKRKEEEEQQRRKVEELKLKEEQQRKEAEELKLKEEHKRKEEEELKLKEEQQRKEEEELKLKEEQKRKEEKELKLKEQQKREEEEEQQRKKEEEIKLKEEQKRKEEEEIQLEKEKEFKMKEEQKRKEEEEQQRKKEEEIKLKQEQKQKEEEEMKLKEEQKRKEEEQQQRKKEEETKLKEQQRKEEEEMKLKEEQNRKEKEELKLKEQKRKEEEEEEQQRKEEESKLKEEQQRKEAEELKLKEEQKRKEEEEQQRKKEEELKLKEEQKRKEEEELKLKEEQKRKEEEEQQQRKVEELKLKEEQQRKKEDELKLKEEQKRKEEEEQQRKKEEEIKLKEEQKRQEKEELKRKEEEELKLQKEEELKLKEQQKQQHEEEKRKKEEQKRKEEEELKRKKEEELKLKEQQKRKEEEELKQKKEEELKLKERQKQQQQEEKRKEEQELKRKKEEELKLKEEQNRKEEEELKRKEDEQKLKKLKRKEEEEKILQEKGTELRKEENIEQTGDELISKLRGKPKTKESELQLQHQTKEETEHTYKLSETSSKEENLHTSRQKETDVDTYERKYAVASTSQLEESVVPKVTRGSSCNQSSLEKECKDGDQMEAKSSTEQDTIIYRTPGGRSYMIERDRGYNEKNVEDLLEKVKQLKIKCGLEVAEKGDTQKDPLASTSAKTYGSDYPLMKEKGNALDATLIETQESKKDHSSQVLEQVKSRLEELERGEVKESSPTANKVEDKTSSNQETGHKDEDFTNREVDPKKEIQKKLEEEKGNMLPATKQKEDQETLSKQQEVKGGKPKNENETKPKEIEKHQETEDKKLKAEKERKEKEKKLEEQEETRLKEEKHKEEEEKKRKEKEESKLKEEKKRKEEEEEKERKEKEESKLKEEEEKKRKEKEESKLKEEKKRKEEEEEKKRKEKEESKLKEEKKRKEEEKCKEDEEKKLKEEEQNKLKEEERKRKEEDKRKEEENRLKDEEKKRKEEVKSRKEAEEKKRKEDEEHKLQEENKRKEEAKLKEEKKRKEEEESKLNEEKKRKEEEEKKRKEEEKNRKEEEEKKRKEEEESKLKEEKKRKEEEKKRKEEEKNRKEEEEKKRKEEEESKLKEEKKRKEEEKKRKEEEKKRKEEEKNRKEEEEKKSKEEDAKKFEEEEQKRRNDEEKAKKLKSKQKKETEIEAKSNEDDQVAKEQEEKKRTEETKDESAPRKTKKKSSIKSDSKEEETPQAVRKEKKQEPIEESVAAEIEEKSQDAVATPKTQRQPAIESPNTGGEAAVRSRVHPSQTNDTSEQLGTKARIRNQETRRDPKKKPQFSSKLHDLEVAKGSRIKLTCSVIGSPEPEIEWYHNGFPLPNDSEKYVSHLDSMGIASLEIRNLLRADTGEYSCIARNFNGQSSTSADLRVRGDFEPKSCPPTFSSGIKDIYQQKRDELVLDCTVGGFPVPKITWLKDGIRLHMSSRFRQSLDVDGKCQLVVSSPSVCDSGQYTCVAQNATWKDEISAFVVVPDAVWQEKEKQGLVQPSTPVPESISHVTGYSRNQLAVPTSYPTYSSYSTSNIKFRRSMADRVVTTGDTVVFNIDVSGDPLPEVTWMKNGKLLPPSAKIRTSSTSASAHSLTLFNITASDLGQYTCRASNMSGSTDCKSTLTFDNRFESYSRDTEDGAHFIDFPETTISVRRNEDLVISCRVKGHPRPKVAWWKGLRDLADSARSYVETDDDIHRLVLKKVTYGDAGTYTVKVSNVYGNQKSYCTVRVKEGARGDNQWDFQDTESILHDLAERRVRRFNKDVPDAIPVPPTATVNGNNVVSLSWSKPNNTGGAPILAFKVESWLLGDGAIWTEVGITVITSMDVYNLKSDREYLFRVTPRNKYGWGESTVSAHPVRTILRTGLPQLHQQLHPQIKALVNTDIQLVCEVSGEPRPEISWFRDGAPLDSTRHPRYETLSIEPRHLLSIKSVSSEDDETKITCEATNTAGKVSTFTRILVVTDARVAEADAIFRQQLDKLSGCDANRSMAPQFTMRPRDRRVQVTFPVRLTCQVIGFPKPDINWFLNKQEIFPSERHSLSVDGNFYTLEISSTKFDDAGIYTVEGRNSQGAVGCQCCLVVDGGIRAYVSPVFTHELEDRSVLEGATISLVARVEAYPAVGVIWHRDGTRLRPCRQYDMRLDSDGSVSLIVSGATIRNGGLYTCTVSNEMGQVSSSARVEVHERLLPSGQDLDVTSTESKAPRFIRKPRSTEVVEGDSLVIVCEVAGDPKPDVIWLRDWLNPDYYHAADQFVRSEGDGSSEYRLTIPCVKLDFTGAYSIIARNAHGEAKAIISLQVYVHDQDRNGMETGLPKVGCSETVPVIVQPLRHLRCCDGDAVTFECRIQDNSTGTLNIRWEKGGKLLRLCKDYTTELKEGVARLSIQRVYPEDEGEYTCVAYNQLGKDSSAACLIVDVADDKENDLMVQLDSRPSGTISARGTPRNTPRTTPSRTFRSTSPINASKKAEGPPEASRPRVRKAPPKFYSLPHNKIAEVGETVRFQCAIGGNPRPKVTWDKDNVAFKSDNLLDHIHFEEHNDNRIIEIRNIVPEDAGLYRITVENELGRIQANARLDVLARSSSRSSSGFIRSGSASSYGINSYYPGLHLSTSSRLGGSGIRGIGTSSYLRGSSTPRFGGAKYRAESAMNEPAEQQQQEQQQPQQELQQQNAPVFIQPLPSQIKVNEAEEVELSVAVQGCMPLTVVWVHNDAVVQNSDAFTYVDHGDGRYGLRLRDVFTHDAGVYFCEVYNRFGEAESWCMLCVTECDTKDVDDASNAENICVNDDCFFVDDEAMTENRFELAAQIVKGPENVSTLLGSTVLLEALIIGRPEPRIRWLQGGKELTPTKDTEMRHADGVAALILHNITADDSGKYIVMAENEFGMDCHYASLAVEGPPDAGGKPAVCDVKADSVTLTWYGSVYDGGSVVTGYVVEVCQQDQETWNTLTSECNSTSFVIHDLQVGCTYSFRVRAKNVHGLSEPSAVSDPLFLNEDITANLADDEYALPFDYTHVEVEQGELFKEKYTVHEELGKGRFGVVYRLTDKASSDAVRAAKCVRCIKAADREKVAQEIDIMNRLRHPKLLQLAAAYDCPKEIILVTEYISGGELFERVVADDFTLTERDCILFMRQICDGVSYMHSKNIVHLDLKPENILCQSSTSHRIKLIDFGLARELDPDKPVRVLFGTPEFIAPEIVSYEPIACFTDMWAVGVVCYVLLSGLSPFMGDSDADTFSNITKADYDFEDEAFDDISSDAKDFISSLLIKRLDQRLSADACLQHKWLAQTNQTMKSVKLSTDRLKKFIIRRKWQKTGNAIRALSRMASLSSSRRNSSCSPSRRSSRMDSICSSDDHSVFTPPGSPLLLRSSIESRTRSPSLPTTHLPNINRSRSPSLPVASNGVNDVNRTKSTERSSRSDAYEANREANRSNTAYTNRSDSGISTCSHSSLLDSFSKPWLIHEEDENDEKTNHFPVGSSGGATVAEKS